MRIIAGALGGRIFDSPKTHRTHPMSDRVRGALFNVLGDITGLTVLDSFAGSGALAFEAVSRGAAHATTIESDRAAQSIIEQNIKSLGLQKQVKSVKASASAWLATSELQQFDIILCDPPYNDLQVKLIQRIATRLASRGTLVLSWPGKMEPPQLTGLVQIEQRNYGDAQLLFFTVLPRARA